MEDDTPAEQPVCTCPPGTLSNLCRLHTSLETAQDPVPVHHDGRPLTAADVGPLIAKELA
jgi:hypothetical protein